MQNIYFEDIKGYYSKNSVVRSLVDNFESKYGLTHDQAIESLFGDLFWVSDLQEQAYGDSHDTLHSCAKALGYNACSHNRRNCV